MRPSTPAPSALDETAPLAAGKPLLILETDKGRDALLAWAEKNLPQGEALVECRGLVGRRRAFRTLPSSPRAELVARHLPTVLRGGLTSLVSYYRVPASELDGEERHYQDGEHSHTYDVVLKVARLGGRATSSMVHA